MVSVVDQDAQRAPIEHEPYWRPLQAIAWIMTRSDDAAAEVGWICGQPDRLVPQTIVAQTSLVLSVEAGEPGYSRPVSDCAADLARKCAAGVVVGYGIPPGEFRRREVPSYEWSDIRFDHASEGLVRPHEMAADPARHWTSLRFDRQRVIEVWPPAPAEKAPTPTAPQSRAGKGGRSKPEWYDDLSALVASEQEREANRLAEGKPYHRPTLTAIRDALVRRKPSRSTDKMSTLRYFLGPMWPGRWNS